MTTTAETRRACAYDCGDECALSRPHGFNDGVGLFSAGGRHWCSPECARERRRVWDRHWFRCAGYCPGEAYPGRSTTVAERVTCPACKAAMAKEAAPAKEETMSTSYDRCREAVASAPAPAEGLAFPEAVALYQAGTDLEFLHYDGDWRPFKPAGLEFTAVIRTWGKKQFRRKPVPAPRPSPIDEMVEAEFPGDNWPGNGKRELRDLLTRVVNEAFEATTQEARSAGWTDGQMDALGAAHGRARAKLTGPRK